MFVTKRTTLILSVLSVLFCGSIAATESISITTPADSSTVTSLPISITGTSSLASTTVRLTVNTTIIGTTTTNGSGNWSFNLESLSNNSYTITADLLSGGSEILATDTNSFTVDVPSITIQTPAENDTIILNTATAQGNSTLSSTGVELYVDSVLTNSTTTDGNGDWQTTYTLGTIGLHTLAAKLIVSGNPVAQHSIDVIGSAPVRLHDGLAQLRLIGGIVPTSGSGNGNGYSYSNSGLSVTVSFTNSFASTPVVLTTGNNSLASTITITSVSSSAVTFLTTLGTSNVHFCAFEIV